MTQLSEVQFRIDREVVGKKDKILAAFNNQRKAALDVLAVSDDERNSLSELVYNQLELLLTEENSKPSCPYTLAGEFKTEKYVIKVKAVVVSDAD